MAMLNIIQSKLKKYWGYTLTDSDIADINTRYSLSEFYTSYFLQSKYAIKNGGKRYLGESIHAKT